MDSPRRNADEIFPAIVQKLSQSNDFKRKTIMIGDRFPAEILYFEGVVDSADIADFVVRPLAGRRFLRLRTLAQVRQALDTGGAFLLAQEADADEKKILGRLVNGHAVLYVPGLPDFYIFEARSQAVRSVQEPSGENVMKGGKDSFVERYRINVSLVRSRLSSPDLVVEEMTVGRVSQTTVGVVYLSTTANPAVVQLVRERLAALDIDSVDAVGIIEEALSGDRNSIFPQVFGTERPDRFCAAVNEGSVGVIIGGFPLAFVGPVSILNHIAAPEDYSRHHTVASAVRILRYVLLVIALVLPAFYLSIVSFHQEMLPTELTMSIIKSQLSVPFSDLLEIIILLVAFEILIEAGLRMPQNIGQAVSIVGGLVVGDAAVNAKIISPIVVIVVALAVISSFTIPDQDFSNAVRMLRFLFCIASAVFGLVGLVISFIALAIYMSRIESLGIPYLAPLLSTGRPTADTFRRRLFRADRRRPEYLGNRNSVRRRSADDE